jgi:hypothetical protein
LQIFIGLIFTVALWFFKENFLYQKIWMGQVMVPNNRIIGPSIKGTTPGSIEGFINTNIPFITQTADILKLPH